MADVDHFKWINDTHGHPAGDRVVNHLGEFLKSLLRTGDFVGRYGGDEFAILLPQTDFETGEKIAERMRQLIARTNFDVGLRDERVTVTFSIGVAGVMPDDTPLSVITRADQAVYQSKHAGRNKVHAKHGADEPVPVGV
jgi:diguanylate cyclase (GGDEF)-like protein